MYGWLLTVEVFLKWVITIGFIILPINLSIYILVFLQLSALTRNYLFNLKERYKDIIKSELVHNLFYIGLVYSMQ